MWNGFEVFKKYEVKAESLEDFLKRYTKRDRHEARGSEYVEVRIASHAEHLNKHGYTFITHHDSVTGDDVSFYGNKSE
jgi:hypothetical protein